MNLSALFNHPAFAGIEAHRIEAVHLILDQARGKNTHESMWVIKKHLKPLTTGKPISKTQGQAMMQALHAHLPPDEQDEFKGVIKVIERFLA